MNREHGYTLIETLVTMVVVVILGASGLYGWQSCQLAQPRQGIKRRAKRGGLVPERQRIDERL